MFSGKSMVVSSKISFLSLIFSVFEEMKMGALPPGGEMGMLIGNSFFSFFSSFPVPSLKF